MTLFPILRVSFLAAAAALARPAFAAADVWKCSGGRFTTIAPTGGDNCEPLTTGMVCGKGNRFISPARPGQKDAGGTACEKIGNSPSPFVDVAAAKETKRLADLQPKPKKRVVHQQPASQNPLQGLAPGALPIAPGEIGKILETVSSAIGSP